MTVLPFPVVHSTIPNCDGGDARFHVSLEHAETIEETRFSGDTPRAGTFFHWDSLRSFMADQWFLRGLFPIVRYALTKLDRSAEPVRQSFWTGQVGSTYGWTQCLTADPLTPGEVKGHGLERVNGVLYVKSSSQLAAPKTGDITFVCEMHWSEEDQHWVVRLVDVFPGGGKVEAPAEVVRFYPTHCGAA